MCWDVIGLEYPEATTHAIIIDETGEKILLIEGVTPWGQRLWDFPGGHIKVGETIKDAVIREVEEETGYSIEPIRLLGVYDNIMKDESSNKVKAHLVDIIWIARVVSGTLDSKKDESIKQTKWFPLTNLKNLVMPPIALQIINDAFTIL